MSDKPIRMGDDCPHTRSHKVVAIINHMQDTGRFMADVRIECADCGRPFQFIGLPLGLNLDGATMGVDGQEARLAIAPVGTIPQPLDGALGFGVRMRTGDEH